MPTETLTVDDKAELGSRKAPRRSRSYTIADIAKARNTDKASARRWCRRNAKAHMSKVNGAWTIPADVFLRLTEANALEKLSRRVTQLEEECALLTRRLDTLVMRTR